MDILQADAYDGLYEMWNHWREGKEDETIDVMIEVFLDAAVISLGDILREATARMGT
jgi:hypothetical protein